MFVRSLDGKEFPVMATHTFDDEINGNMNISMTITPNRANNQFINELSEFWELVDDDATVYKIIYCDERAIGTQPTKTIRAIPKFYDDFNSSRIYPRYEGSYAVDELFRIVFQDSGYSFRTEGTWNNIRIEGYGDGETRLSMFQRILKRINAEFEFMMNSVTIKSKIGSERDVMYRYRLNASNIVKEVDAQDFYTYAKGFGNYDNEDQEEKGWENAKLKREYTSPLAKLLGKREAPPIKDGRVKDAKLMDESLKELVDNSIKISVTADLIDLSNQNYPYAITKLGDTVWLIDERIGLKEEVRVVKRTITKNWKGEITDINFTFGSEGMVSRYQGKINGAVGAITDILEGRKKLPFQAMSDEIQILTHLMQNVQTQFEIAENGSLIAINKKDPNLVVIFNANGLFVSDDGGKNPKAAITGRGIMGEHIIAYSITADKLEANAITVGFNNSSTNVKLFSNRIEFYSSNRKTAELDDRGMTFWYGTRQIGDLGEGYKTGQTSVRGINMRLHTQGDYIAWSHLKSINDSSYTTMMTMDPYGKMTGWQGIDVSMKMRVVDNDGYGHELHDALQVGWAFKGLNLSIPSRINSDGTVAEWYNFNF